MPTYVFSCATCKEAGRDPSFTIILSSVPKKIVQGAPCPECKSLAKRDFGTEIKSQAVVGLTPISKSTTVPGSLYNTVKHAFGANHPDDPNQAPFRDSGELDAFMNGANDLGKPKIDQRTGKPLVRKNVDGSYSYVREGAKIVKYDKNATPSRDDVRKTRASKSATWRGGEGKFENGAGKDIRITG